MSKEFRVTWTKIPTSMNPKKVLFVKVEQVDQIPGMPSLKKNAELLAIDHIERTHGLANGSSFLIDEVEPSRPTPVGSVSE